jgi:hypothetical protein
MRSGWGIRDIPTELKWGGGYLEAEKEKEQVV